MCFIALRFWLRRKHVVQAEASSSKGTRSWVAGKGGPAPRPPAPPGTVSPTGSSIVESDYLLSYIASQLASRPAKLLPCATASSATRSGPSSGPSSATRSGPSSSGPSSAVPSPLSPDTRLWLVAWEELRIEKLIGRGSFGVVYLSRWNATPVAVKLLLQAGARAAALPPPRLRRGQLGAAASKPRSSSPPALCTPCSPSADSAGGVDGLDLPDAALTELYAEAELMARIRHP